MITSVDQKDICVAASERARCRDPGILEILFGLKSFHQEAAGRLHAVLAESSENPFTGGSQAVRSGS